MQRITERILNRSERLAKYNQLLRIEEELGTNAKFAGANFRKVGNLSFWINTRIDIEHLLNLTGSLKSCCSAHSCLTVSFSYSYAFPSSTRSDGSAIMFCRISTCVLGFCHRGHVISVLSSSIAFKSLRCCSLVATRELNPKCNNVSFQTISDRSWV